MNRRKLLWAACGGMFVFGIVLAILGALFGLPHMRARLGIDLAQQGDVLLALFFGVLLSTILTGPMIDSFGNKPVLTASAFLTALSLGAFALAGSFAQAMIAATILGFGGGGLNTSANALIADIYPDDRAAMLNVVGVFFGVGALIAPLMTGFLAIPQTLIASAAIAAVAALAYALLGFPQPRERVGFSLLASVRIARTPGVLLFAFILFCESGNESSIGGWTSTYVNSLGASPRVATSVLAAYWAALMIGRIIASKIVRFVTAEQLIVLSAAGSAVGSAMLFLSRSAGVVAVGAVIIGLSFAAIYPTILAMAADRYERLAGTIFGFLFAAGLGGGMLFPFAIGHIASHASVHAGMAVPLGGAIVVAILTFVLMRRRTS